MYQLLLAWSSYVQVPVGKIDAAPASPAAALPRLRRSKQRLNAGDDINCRQTGFVVANPA
jgi:hypothetical protein